MLMAKRSEITRGLAVAVVSLFIVAGAALGANALVNPSPRGPVVLTGAESATEPTETPEPTETSEPADAGQQADGGQKGDHGALVSTAAQMTTPDGFKNHGAFVSCVAHLNATLATIDWSTVTPASCGQASEGGSAPNHAPKGHGHGHGRPSWAGKPGG